MKWLSWLITFFYFTFTQCFPDKIYHDLSHYCYFSKLASCISQNKLFEKPLNKGGCDNSFCMDKNMANTTIVKIYEAPFIETGTGFIAVDTLNKEIIVSFRGSTTSADWISDMKFYFTNYEPLSKLPESWRKCGGCKVHKGLFTNMTPIVKTYLFYLQDLYLEYSDYNLILTGHSLGGALATLLSIELRVRGFYPNVYSYGSPKLFNTEMSDWVNQIFETVDSKELIKNGKIAKFGIYTIIHHEDYVPMLPPTFKCAGVEFYIDKRELPHLKEDVRLLEGGDMTKTSNLADINNRFTSSIDLFNSFEHRNYFIRINKCGD